MVFVCYELHFFKHKELVFMRFIFHFLSFLGLPSGASVKSRLTVQDVQMMGV